LIKSKTRKSKNNDSDDDSCDSGDDSDDNPTLYASPRGKESNSKAPARTKGNVIKGNVKSNEVKKDGGGSSSDDSCSEDDDDDGDSEDEDWKAGYEDGGTNSEFNLMVS
jgi:hypothetical protein